MRGVMWGTHRTPQQLESSQAAGHDRSRRPSRARPQLDSARTSHKPAAAGQEARFWAPSPMHRWRACRAGRSLACAGEKVTPPWTVLFDLRERESAWTPANQVSAARHPSRCQTRARTADMLYLERAVPCMCAHR